MTDLIDKATEVLATRAVLCGVRISYWGARVKDEDASDKIKQDANADDDSGDFYKMLVPKSAIDPIIKAYSAIRRFHKAMTLRWTDNGLGVLPVANHDAFVAGYNALAATAQELVDQFLADYDSNVKDGSYVEDAKRRLGNLYKASDYPSVEEVRAKFGSSLRMLPIPTAADFRCQMGAEAIAAAQKALEEANSLALRAAAREGWERARVVVLAMMEKLRAYHPASEGEKARGKFQDTLVTNVIKIADQMPGLNILSDPRVQATAERMGEELTYYSAEELRNDNEARKATADAAESVLRGIDEALSSL